MTKTIIGVMGPGSGATERDLNTAEELGRLIALEGWVLLTGGRNIGVMEAASRGAKRENGLTIGILPSSDRLGMSEFIDIPICTDMGSARNNINVLSSKVVVGCGTGLGTTSEIVLAIKAGKPVILLNQKEAAVTFLNEMASDRFQVAETASETIDYIKSHLM